VKNTTKRLTNKLGGNGQSALEQMKQIEKQLLNKGLRTKRFKILNVKQELLKLNTAIQQQGEEKQTPI
jgi:hypothetical protein